MVTFRTLASGSSGNAMILCCGETRLLIDAGISCRRIHTYLKEQQLTPDALSAVLLTHEHTDHVSGLKTLLERSPLPLHASPGTAQALRSLLPPSQQALLCPVPVGQSESIGCCRVTSFATCHDASESVGYRIDTPEGAVGILTDTGHIPRQALHILSGVALLVLESNYDDGMLMNGPYPYALKKRIAGERGHLANGDAADFALAMAQQGTRRVLLVHLSRENNTPSVAAETVRHRLRGSGWETEVYVAPPTQPSEELILCSESPFCVSAN